MKKFLCFFLVVCFSCQAGRFGISADVPVPEETAQLAPLSSETGIEFDSRFNGQVIVWEKLEANEKTIIISASDVALTGLKLAGKGNTLLVTGDRVTLEDCSFDGAETTVAGKGFFAHRCEFDSLAFGDRAADAEAAYCSVRGTVSARGRNQVLYGTRCGAIEADGASDLSVIRNDARSVVLRGVSYVNLTGNRGSEISYDSRPALWGDNLSGVLEGEEYSGADESRLPQNHKERFEESTVREKIFFRGSFLSLNACVEAAAASEEELVIPAGVYTEAEPFAFNNRERFNLAAYGVLVRFRNYTQSAVLIDRSADIGIEGLTIDHMRAANAQGTVVSAEENSVVWKPDEGYGFDITDAALFSPSGAGLAFHAGERLPFADYYSMQRVKNDDGTFLINGVTGLSSGDRLTFRGCAAYVCSVRDSGDVCFRDLTVWNGSGFAFSAWQGTGRVSILRCQVVPGPKPEGAHEEKMLSACDASHFSNMRIGPVIEDSVFTDMTDDGTNINGHYAVASGYDPSTRTFTIADRYTVGTGTYASQVTGVEKGDKIRILTRNFRLIGEVAAEGPVKDGKLTVAETVTLPTTDVVLQNLSAQSSGFFVYNCVVERIRSRGLLIKACDGIIEHCTIKDTRMAGILIAPESADWPEFGFTSNVTVRNNKLLGTGYANPDAKLYAPIAVCGDLGETEDRARQLHHELLVIGNLIANRRNNCAIWLSHVDGGCVQNNVVTERDISVCGDEENCSPIAVDSSTNLNISGNVCPEGTSRPVQVLEGARQLQGSDLSAEDFSPDTPDSIGTGAGDETK